MALELLISRRAAREINRVADWWAVNRLSAPGAVRQDLEATFALLLEHPAIGTTVSDASSRGVRRFHVDRINHWVYYRVRGERFEVLSIWHSSRGVGPVV